MVCRLRSHSDESCKVVEYLKMKALIEIGFVV